MASRQSRPATNKLSTTNVHTEFHSDNEHNKGANLFATLFVLASLLHSRNALSKEVGPLTCPLVTAATHGTIPSNMIGSLRVLLFEGPPCQS